MSGTGNLLAADIGGTKAALGLYDASLNELRREVLPTASFKSAGALLSAFLGSDRACAACVAIAGRIINGVAVTPNLPWSISEASIAAEAGVDCVTLTNDLAATAYGLTFLPQEQLVTLQTGDSALAGGRGTMALIAAGTGLGEALLTHDGTRYQPLASEGGHADFAPANERETALLGYLRARFGHVSYERILSGPGLYNLYRFLVDTGSEPEVARVAGRLRSEVPPAVICGEALAGTDTACEAALSLFTRIYGAEAGNLALKGLATGGVFLGGGIAPKILPLLTDTTFLEGFCDKGRLGDFMRRLPVKVITNESTALIGAAHLAAGLAVERAKSSGGDR